MPQDDPYEKLQIDHETGEIYLAALDDPDREEQMADLVRRLIATTPSINEYHASRWRQNFEPTLESDDGIIEDPTGFGAVMDAEMGEFCSLDAMAVRHTLLQEFSKEGHERDGTDPATIRDIQVVNGTARADKPEKTRLAVHVGDYDGLRFASWIDVEKEGLIKRKIANDWEDIDDEDIYFGFMTPSLDTDKTLYFPIVKNVVTPTSCNVVLPNGAEIASEAYNRPELLARLRRVIDESSGYEGGVSEEAMSELLDEVKRALLGIPDSQRLVEIVEQNTRNYKRTPTERVARSLANRSEIRIPREINTRDGDIRTIYLLGTLKGQITTGTPPTAKEADFLLADDGLFFDEDTGIFSNHFSLWSSLDNDVYGPQPPEHPRCQVIIDELGRAGLFEYGLDGVTLRNPTAENEAYFVKIIDRILKYSGQERSPLSSHIQGWEPDSLR